MRLGVKGKGLTALPQLLADITKIFILSKRINKSNRYRCSKMDLKLNSQHSKGKMQKGLLKTSFKYLLKRNLNKNILSIISKEKLSERKTFTCKTDGDFGFSHGTAVCQDGFWEPADTWIKGSQFELLGWWGSDCCWRERYGLSSSHSCSFPHWEQLQLKYY